MSIRIGELTVIHNSRFYLAVHAAESGRRKPGWRESRGNCSLYATRPYLTFHAFIISYHRSSRTSTNDVASVSSLIAGISSFDDDAVRYHEIYAEQYGVSPTTRKIWIFFIRCSEDCAEYSSIIVVGSFRLDRSFDKSLGGRYEEELFFEVWFVDNWVIRVFEGLE